MVSRMFRFLIELFKVCMNCHCSLSPISTGFKCDGMPDCGFSEGFIADLSDEEDDDCKFFEIKCKMSTDLSPSC